MSNGKKPEDIGRLLRQMLIETADAERLVTPDRDHSGGYQEEVLVNGRPRMVWFGSPPFESEIERKLRRVAVIQGVDISKKNWIWDVVTQLASEHEEINESAPKSRGRPEKLITQKYWNRYNFLEQVEVLRALMHVVSGRRPSNAEVARVIRIRSLPQHAGYLLPPWDLPKHKDFEKQSELIERKIARFSREFKQMRKDLADNTGGKLNWLFYLDFRNEILADNWVPTRTELEGHSEWEKYHTPITGMNRGI